jgi:hypothetical protein
MARIVLLPKWESAPDWNEVIGKVFGPEKPLPEPWQPRLEEARRLEEVEAFAFPTPFAWAEMMAAILRQSLYNHLLFELYENLVLGLVLGHLHLEVVDLKDKGGDFGKVLEQTDNRYRYFGILRGSPRNQNLQGKVFGATSPDSLFWPSPRRSEDEWRELREAINRDSNLQGGYQVLADFRELLRQQKLWVPDALPWVRGLDRIIGDRSPSDGCKHFHMHSRSVGPILVTFLNDKRALYIPVYERNFAAELLRALTGSFNPEDGRIALRDDRGTKHYEILMPTVPTGGDPILAGAGTVRVIDAPGRIRSYSSNRVRLYDDEKGRGLFSLLQPLYVGLGNDVNLGDIKDRPFFYPDIIRIAVNRLGDAGLPGADVSFSDQAYELAFDPNSPGLPLVSELENPAQGNRGFVLRYSYEGRTKTALYIEEYAGRHVGDLTALGYVLWLFFTGTAEYRDGMICDSGLAPLMDRGTGQPLYPTTEVYQKVRKEQREHRKLAALQRFIRAYAERGGEADIDRLCSEAAKAFARWVWSEEVIPNGRQPRQQLSVQLGSLRINLARD